MVHRANEAIKAKHLALTMSTRPYTMIAFFALRYPYSGFQQDLNFHVIMHNLSASPHHPVL